ncbi:MAG: protease modulator HflK [Candidatus Riflebacteria bacterium]|nr:protease modulator HflK [Candidatus Riflebacteria bacterium]
MSLKSNFVIIALLATCVFSGLDKLIVTTLFVLIIFFSDLFNKILVDPTSDSKPKYSKTAKIEFCFLFFMVWLAILSEVICLTGGHGLSVDDSFNSRFFCVCVFLILYFYSVFAIRTIQKDDTSETLVPEAQWYRMLQYLSVYQFIFGLFFIATDSFGIDISIREKYLYFIYDYSIFIILGYLFCLLTERLLDTGRIFYSLLSNNTKKYEVPFFISVIAASRSFKQSIIKTIELISGVDLSKSEIAKYIIDHVEPVTIIAILIFWLISSVVIVPPDNEAIFYRLGKIIGEQSYKPGLHFKLPWPLEKMELYQPNSIRTLNIGFTPDPTQRHIIWSKAHAKENFFLLVGDGVEIIAVDCQLYYKINDLYKYVTKVQNPEKYIEALAYKYLTANTISKNFDQIMSQNRNNLIAELRNNIQADIDKNDLGITIVEVVFLAIHPPLQVADAYEDVISAQLDRQTTILKAKSESIKEISMKKAFAEDEVNKAKGYSATKVADAFGEAMSFESRIIGYNTEPDLEEFRLRLDSLQRMAKSKNLYVIDKSFMRQKDRIILNLQN